MRKRRRRAAEALGKMELHLFAVFREYKPELMAEFREAFEGNLFPSPALDYDPGDAEARAKRQRLHG